MDYAMKLARLLLTDLCFKKGPRQISEDLLTFGECKKFFFYGFPPILLDAITFNFEKCKISVVCKYKLTKIKQLRVDS
jgi:hypothetical protein